MTLDVRTFFQATNPSRTLAVENEDDLKYYIDFSSVRGGNLIEELKDNITFFCPDEPTCELFTGHIGCGKSTELRRLEAELKQEGFHVVYFESSQDLEMMDVDVGDILLAIARRVSESLQEVNISLQPGYFKNLFNEVTDFLQTPVSMSDVSLSVGIASITTQIQGSPNTRDKLRGYLEPRTKGLIEAINQEIMATAIQRLKRQGKKGLVVIIDNLDRLESSQKPWGRPQPEYLFVDRGEQLRQLNCHVIYTMPLALMFSNDLGGLTSRFGVDPKVLPMVPVRLRNGELGEEGMALMQQMALARAFPNLAPEERLNRINEVFDQPETLDRLCQISGGHVREFLRLLNDWIKKDRQLPLSREGLETVIKARRNQVSLAITDDEWDLLRQVQESKQTRGDQEYQVLIRSMFVYEYRDSEGSWFEINPILAESGKLSGG
ncbi:MAG: ATP-binding protein [Symploca sp. SIO1C2]|nr:ATP-binding protein [Symploca sp. SIO1C2]